MLKKTVKILARPKFMASDRRRSQLLRFDPELVRPDMLRFGQALIKEFELYEIPFFIHCGARSPQEQQDAFDGGFSNAKFGESPHNYDGACALDIIHGTLGWELSDDYKEKRELWRAVHHIGQIVQTRMKASDKKSPLQITWGGNFKGLYDPAHWELTHWKKLRDENEITLIS
jgi:hypothetical protein